MIQEPQLMFFSVAYPNSFFDDVKRGKKFNFMELVKTGLVAGYLTFDKNEADSIQDNLKLWASNQPIGVIINFDEEQKRLDRFCDITKKTGKIDHLGFNDIFAKICFGSIVLSEYKDEDKPMLVSTDMLEAVWEDSGLKAYYVAIATHPDLLEGDKINLYADISIEKFKDKLRSSKIKSKTRRYWTEPQKEQVRIRQDGKCAICQKHPPRWEYDHIDNDRNNDALSNCQGLCPNCHSVKTHEH